VGKVVTKQAFLGVLRISSVNIVPTKLHTPSLHAVLPEGQTGEAREPSKKQCSFGTWEALDRKVLSLCTQKCYNECSMLKMIILKNFIRNSPNSHFIYYQSHSS
jgi:hypothetical protein